MAKLQATNGKTKAKKTNEPTTRVTLQWSSVNPDPVQYKPYNPQFLPVNVFVEVDVPTKYVQVNSEHGMVISLQGVMYITKEISAAIQAAHYEE